MSAPSLGHCDEIGPAIVCYRPQNIHKREVIRCPTCERRTPFIVQWDGMWYGVTLYCVACLDKWMDGERMCRPFRRNWRKERAALIRGMWESALSPTEYDRWTRAEMDAYFDRADEEQP